MEIGKIIVELRKERGISRAELAKNIGVTYHALSKYETGDRQIDHELLVKVADYFNVTVDYLLGRNNVQSFSTSIEEIEISDHTIDELTILVAKAFIDATAKGLPPEEAKEAMQYTIAALKESKQRKGG